MNNIPMTMTRDARSGDWVFTDEWGTVWRLTPTGDQSMPLTIILAEWMQNTSQPHD